MKLEEFMQTLKARPAPNKKQIENLKKISKISKKFYTDAGIEEGATDGDIGADTIVLESGHQPNFIPHTGVLKKIFLLRLFGDRVKTLGRKPICLFGFSDYNVCTAELMYQNKLPATNTEGYANIGFKFKSQEMWKRLNAIEKPTLVEWEKMLTKIRNLYSGYTHSGIEGLNLNLAEFMELMSESYDKAKNFADMNAFTIARVCSDMLRLNVIFFRLSDMQSDEILLEEGNRILSNFREFQRISSTIKNKDAFIQRNYSRNLIPFWYECECGANVELYLTSGSNIHGTCGLCGKEYALDSANLSSLFTRISPDAIARNLIYFEGFGTALFISGSGGSLKYGVTSNAISRRIGFNVPLNTAWKSRDKYLGAAHLTALYALMKLFKLKLEDFLDAKILSDKISTALSNSKGTKMELALENQINSTLNIFRMNYSMIDLFSILDSGKDITKAWQIDRLKLVKFDEFYILEGDVIYNKPTKWVKLSDEQISKIYDNLNYIKDKI